MAATLRVLTIGLTEAEANLSASQLREAGYRCDCTAHPGGDALGPAVAGAGVDLVLCATAAPGVDGLGILRRWRAHDADTPFVLVASAPDDRWALEALQAGATGLLTGDVSGLARLVEGALGRSRDSQERRRVERALLLSEARLAGVVASAMDAIISIDDEHRIILFNEAAERMFRIAAADAIGGPMDRFVPDRFRREHRRHVEAFARTGVTSRRMGGLARVSARRADGDEFPAEASISQVAVGAGRVLTVILRDVSEQVRAEEALAASREELRALSLRLQSMIEHDRARIAREVHDQLGQALTAIKLEATRLATVSGRPRLAAAGVKAIIGLADSTIASVRRIASELRPAILDHLGLAPALEWLVKESERRTGIRTMLELVGEAEVDPDRATACFRIAQEALTNVARHAGASEVTLRLTTGSDGVGLVVSDDGAGIPVDSARGPSLGLLGMRERAAALGGTFSAGARLPRGTQVTVWLPTRPEPPAAVG